MKTSTERLIVIGKVLLGIALAIGAILGYDMGVIQPREAGRLVPPVVQPQALSSSARPILVTVNTAAITTTTNFTGMDWSSERYSGADVYYSIDQTDVNTLTLTLQVSPDNATWINHVASSGIVTDNVADANGYIAAAVNMQYFRVTATAGNTEAVTPTIQVYLR
jgi:hypothetical protein